MGEGILQVLLIVWIALEWVLRLVALFVVPRNRVPNSGLSWLLYIFLVPVPGWIAFAIFGSSKLPKNRRDIQTSLDYYIDQIMYDVSQQSATSHLVDVRPNEKYANSVYLSAGLTHLPLFGGNKLEPIVDYTGSIQRVIQDIEQARRYVLVEYYILALDEATEPFFKALESAARRGVHVYVLYDSFGSRKFSRRKEMVAHMKAAGIAVQAMLPLRMPGRGYTRPDLRNHRKLVAIDGIIGYTGSLNMITRDYHRKDDIVYDELVVRAEGPVVAQLEAVFFSDWVAETGQVLQEQVGDMFNRLEPRGEAQAHVIPSGPGYTYENNRQFFASLFYAARKEITIVNPYFVPDESLVTALLSAAKRGVIVTLVNSSAHDQWMVAHAQRSYYEQLLEAGVLIYLYRAPTLLHSKYAIVDDDACFVGSSNMDIRSFELNQELTLTSYDTAFVARMQEITEEYLTRSYRLKKEEWDTRPPRKQLLDNIARLTSSLQ